MIGYDLLIAALTASLGPDKAGVLAGAQAEGFWAGGIHAQFVWLALPLEMPQRPQSPLVGRFGSL
jgi:hypothetical protein